MKNRIEEWYMMRRSFTVQFLNHGVILCCAMFLMLGCASRYGYEGQFCNRSSEHEPDPIHSSGISTYLSATTPSDDAVETQYRLARHFQQQGKHEIAVEILLDVIKTAPGHAKAYNALGVSYDCLKNFDLSIISYKHALRLRPDSHATYNNLGYSYFLQHDFPSALKFFKQAAHLNPTRRIYHNNLGLCYMNVNELEKARDEFVLAGNHHYLEKINQMMSAQASHASPTEPAGTVDIDNAPPPDAGGDLPPPQAPDPSSEGPIETPASPPETTDDPAPHHTTRTDTPNNFSYAVQAGVFKKYDDALNLLGKFHSAGLRNIYITKVDRKPPYYRVRLGPFDTEDGAKDMAARIFNRHHLKSIVVIEKQLIDHPLFPSSGCNPFTQGASRNGLNLSGIEISNGNGERGMAGEIGTYLSAYGFTNITLTNASTFHYTRTKIFYRPNHFTTAYYLAKWLSCHDIAVSMKTSNRLRAHVKLLIGRDLIPIKDNFKKKAPHTHHDGHGR